MGYTDLTTEFDHKDLLTHQNMDALAENDKYNHLDSGNKMEFVQVSAPVGWSKLTADTDKVLRMTDGAGGGSGGSLALSTGFTLNHTHADAGHTHSIPSHSHELDYVSTGNEPTGGNYVVSVDSPNSLLYESVGPGGATHRRMNNDTDAVSDTSAVTDPGMDTKLSNVAFAYLDVIACVKG